VGKSIAVLASALSPVSRPPPVEAPLRCADHYRRVPTGRIGALAPTQKCVGAPPMSKWAQIGVELRAPRATSMYRRDAEPALAHGRPRCPQPVGANHGCGGRQRQPLRRRVKRMESYGTRYDALSRAPAAPATVRLSNQVGVQRPGVAGASWDRRTSATRPVRPQRILSLLSCG
jgi:hypothetical protein